MEQVTVYTKPACVQCVATKRALNQAGIPYITIDVTEDEAAYQYVTSLGYLAAPVVTVGDDHWSGFQPDKIKQLTKQGDK